MSTNKTPNLGMHDPIGTDQFKRDEIYENFRTLDAQFGGDPIAINIIQGTQIINAVKQSMATFTGMKGRTLVNLLGRNGSIENGLGAFYGTVTRAEDTAVYVSGTKSLKLTKAVSSFEYASINYQAEVADYLLVAEVKNGTLSSGIAVSVKSSTPRNAIQ